MTFDFICWRKQKYFYRGRLDWDDNSSAGKYVRDNCKPLRVREVHGTGCDGSAKPNSKVLPCVFGFLISIIHFPASVTCYQRPRSTTSCLTSLKACWSTSLPNGCCWLTPWNTRSLKEWALARRRAARPGRLIETSAGDTHSTKDWTAVF